MKQVRKWLLLVVVLGGVVLTGCAESPFDQDPSQNAVDNVYTASNTVTINATATAAAIANKEAATIKQSNAQAVATANASNAARVAAVDASEAAAVISKNTADASLRSATYDIGKFGLTLLVVGGSLVVLTFAGAGGVYLFGQAFARARAIMPNKHGDLPVFIDKKTGRVLNLNVMSTPVLFADAFEQLGEATQVALFMALQRTRVARALATQKVPHFMSIDERKRIMRQGAAMNESDIELPASVTAQWEQLQPGSTTGVPQLPALTGMQINNDGTTEVLS